MSSVNETNDDEIEKIIRNKFEFISYGEYYFNQLLESDGIVSSDIL